jgi:glutamate-1-semialdehyde 2,1-aminomutase
LREAVAALDLEAQVTGVGSLFHLHFTASEVRSARAAEDADHDRIRMLHEALLSHGCYFYAGRLGFLSTAHTATDIDQMVAATRLVLSGG